MPSSDLSVLLVGGVPVHCGFLVPERRYFRVQQMSELNANNVAGHKVLEIAKFVRDNICTWSIDSLSETCSHLIGTVRRRQLQY